jgi:hypothetical protein
VLGLGIMHPDCSEDSQNVESKRVKEMHEVMRRGEEEE